MTDSASTWTDALSSLTPIFQSYCDSSHAPGCAFGVVAGGQIVLSGGIGVINPGEDATPAADTVYRIASMTKSFAALAILLLRDEGKLRLDDVAADYVPELRSLHYPTGDSAAITVRQLLTMSSGWPEDNPWGDRQLWRSDAQLVEILQDGVPFANAPGVVFEYSNLGYMVLGRIVAAVSGESSLSFITRRILEPLGMTDTVWNEADVPSRRLARGCHWLDGEWVEEPLLPSGGDVAAFGGLYSTVADLARWVQCMLAAWPPRDDAEASIVRRATLREMQQPWRLYSPAADAPELGRPIVRSAGGYGYGLSITHEGDLYIVSHAGGLPGYGSHMAWLPDYDLGIIALGNVRYAPMRQAATEALRLLAQQAERRRPRLHSGQAGAPPAESVGALQAAYQAANRLLAGWDDGLADRLFADNFFLDDSRARWQAEITRLAAVHGPWQEIGPLEPENALRGAWKLTGTRGVVRAFLTLAPTTPPRVQELSLESMLPPGPALQSLLDQLLRLLDKPSRTATYKLFAGDAAPAAESHTFYDKVRLVSVLCGPCRLGEILAGDGERWVRLRLEGTKAGVEAELTLDVKGRKFVSARFRQVR